MLTIVCLNPASLHFLPMPIFFRLHHSCSVLIPRFPFPPPANLRHHRIETCSYNTDHVKNLFKPLRNSNPCIQQRSYRRIYCVFLSLCFHTVVSWLQQRLYGKTPIASVRTHLHPQSRSLTIRPPLWGLRSGLVPSRCEDIMFRTSQ
jgi:hypothetical protein